MAKVTATGGNPAAFLISLLPPDGRAAYPQIQDFGSGIGPAETALKGHASGAPDPLTETGASLTEHQELQRLMRDLDQIAPGHGGASAYHDLMVKALSFVFHPHLADPSKEEKLHCGRKRVDIVFTNDAKDGFFYSLNLRHRVYCPYIFVECKNYATDPQNPELDQLTGRFGRRRGQFGILVCRHVADKLLIVQRCRDVVNDDRGYVLVLDDADIKTLVELRLRGAMKDIDSYLDRAYRRLVM